MTIHLTNPMAAGMLALLALLQPATAEYQGWQHSGPLAILTSPDGANLPATAAEKDFPLLVRLKQRTFDFSQAKPNGDDIRFSAAGKPLAYQVDEWDPAQGRASVFSAESHRTAAVRKSNTPIQN